ncbi:MAG: type II toxin-antitoxin system Phd/YefM family antitoxin [Anaerolineales bacterium]|nr:type II toxin-antitoxin system Phd/YefM family antitoxin [Anaerolineales bacterium]
MLHLPIAKAHNRLSTLLKKVAQTPIVLTRRGKAVGVLISPEEYERLKRFEAYDTLVSIAQTLRESGLTADELHRTSREDLEGRP